MKLNLFEDKKANLNFLKTMHKNLMKDILIF